MGIRIPNPITGGTIYDTDDPNPLSGLGTTLENGYKDTIREIERTYKNVVGQVKRSGGDVSAAYQRIVADTPEWLQWAVAAPLKIYFISKEQMYKATLWAVRQSGVNTYLQKFGRKMGELSRDHLGNNDFGFYVGYTVASIAFTPIFATNYALSQFGFEPGYDTGFSEAWMEDGVSPLDMPDAIDFFAQTMQLYERYPGGTVWNAVYPGGRLHNPTDMFQPLDIMMENNTKNDTTGFLAVNYFDAAIPAAPSYQWAGSAQF